MGPLPYLLIASCFLPMGYAHIRSGSIVCAVVDSSGAAVAAAEVELTLAETNSTYKSVTNDSGQYTFPYLQLGEYRVAVRKAGFKTAEVTGVRVATAETVRVPVSFEVGAVTASVEVTADAAGVEIESASVGGVTNQGLVETLPNLNDNPFYFATLLPGVVGRDELGPSLLHLTVDSDLSLPPARLRGQLSQHHAAGMGHASRPAAGRFRSSVSRSLRLRRHGGGR